MFKLNPYDYQQKDIEFSYHSLMSYGYAALLMEMGTGKTKVSLNTSELIIRFEKAKGLIIIPPKSLISTWEDEVLKQTFFEPDFSYWQNAKPLTSPSLITFINVETFQRSNKILKEFLQEYCQDRIIILDESTKIKNPKAQRTKNVLDYTLNAKYKMILTGTEITTSLLDLYTQYEFLKNGFWGLPNFWLFRSKYAELQRIKLPKIYNPKLKKFQERTFNKVIGFKRIGELTSKISHCTVRRKKKDCLDLPEKVFQDIHLEMTKTQEKIYHDLKRDLIAEYKDQILTVQAKVSLFIRFRQITGGFMPESGDFLGSPKLAFIKDDSEDYEGKIIIWSCFTAEINHLHKELKNSVKYDGKSSQAEKDKAINSFRNNPDIKYFIANPQSAAFGLNLQFCNLVYNYSRTLSPELDVQSQDRCHRIGVKGSVLYKNLVCKGTIDERVQNILDSRHDMRESFQDLSIGDFFKLI
jgi:SNF2 family DNA or RNA helicase